MFPPQLLFGAGKMRPSEEVKKKKKILKLIRNSALIFSIAKGLRKGISSLPSSI